MVDANKEGSGRCQPIMQPIEWDTQKVALPLAAVARNVLAPGEVKAITMPQQVDDTSMFLLTMADGKKFRVVVKESQ